MVGGANMTEEDYLNVIKQQIGDYEAGHCSLSEALNLIAEYCYTREKDREE